MVMGWISGLSRSCRPVEGDAENRAYEELSGYTLSHWTPAFIHQYVVDTYAAQHVNKQSKPIAVAFSLAGLYLHNELGYPGREVQKAHMRLAKKKAHLPSFSLPVGR